MNHYEFAKFLGHLLDTKFKAGKFRFGLDPLLDLVPGLGDIIGLILSLYIVWVAKHMSVPEKEIAHMIRNVIFDFIMGLIPVLGFVGDFVFRANIRNLAIIERYATRTVIDGEFVAGSR